MILLISFACGNIDRGLTGVHVRYVLAVSLNDHEIRGLDGKGIGTDIIILSPPLNSSS
jgi:hypothetical protein